ncbi:unnamed protein product [Lymnaea stagnalis]|uniref:Chitin-binding type-2 domain-containing protein n=1 Tax=Lymnaea stagnalis TaxID=6523 RepID=A0AAV2HAM9_LYMST
MSPKFLISAIIVGLVAAEWVDNVPNRCPQPTDSNPNPPAFLYAHPEDCQRFITCAHGLPTVMSCAPKTRFSDVFQTCVGEGTHYDTCTRDNAVRECSRGATLIGHPQICQRYYNCSDTAQRRERSFLGAYEVECTYPDLFDIVEKRCKPFKEAYCGPYRVPGIGPCDYVNNLCGGAHCEPCGSRLSSCVDQPNGFNAHSGRQWSPYYVKCDSGRTVEFNLFCPKHFTGTQAIFHPINRECVSLWEIPRSTGFGLAPSCDGKTDGKYRVEERADVYYSCPGAQVSYCRSGSAFDLISQQCTVQ